MASRNCCSVLRVLSTWPPFSSLEHMILVLCDYSQSFWTHLPGESKAQFDVPQLQSRDTSESKQCSIQINQAAASAWLPRWRHIAPVLKELSPRMLRILTLFSPLALISVITSHGRANGTSRSLLCCVHDACAMQPTARREGELRPRRSSLWERICL